MKTNLIFKRQVVIDGVNTTVTRIIPVDVPNIESGSGWVLSGHTDVIEVLNNNVVEVIPTNNNNDNPVKDAKPEMPQENKDLSTIEKFESDVQGTAKLVRSKGVIKIVARRGKSTYNQSTPNGVCINDFTKNEFFKSCRSFHGDASGIYQFHIRDGKTYEYWNDVIDKEYIRQKNLYIKRITSA